MYMDIKCERKNVSGMKAPFVQKERLDCMERSITCSRYKFIMIGPRGACRK
jgi:hypothetical protein